MALEVVILAAGQGTRMKSDLPKVLHTLAGRPLLAHVLSTADDLAPARIHVVIGHQAERVKNTIDTDGINAEINWVEQREQLGTGHAVLQAMPGIDPDATVLVLAGDVPLIQSQTLRPLCEAGEGIHLLTAVLENADGFGRIVRDENNAVIAIVEHKDASDAQLAIREINTGVMAVNATRLEHWLSRVGNENVQGEYYLPDIIAEAANDGAPIEAVSSHDTMQISGINSRAELARLERGLQARLAEQLMSAGVGLSDPSRIDIRGQLSAGRDCQIDFNVLFEGAVSLGKRVRIGPNVVIRDSQIGDDCCIEANSIVDGARLAAGCNVGPFARLRPEAELASGSRIGNFVEIKKSKIGAGSKVNHLAYVGDSLVGSNVNIGAGVITCNYDGANKHRTIIGNDVFVGSDCQLVAPVSIGDGATIGAGSTITEDAPAGRLSLSRSRQQVIDAWRRPAKK